MISISTLHGEQCYHLKVFLAIGIVVVPRALSGGATANGGATAKANSSIVFQLINIRLWTRFTIGRRVPRAENQR